VVIFIFTLSLAITLGERGGKRAFDASAKARDDDRIALAVWLLLAVCGNESGSTHPVVTMPGTGLAGASATLSWIPMSIRH